MSNEYTRPIYPKVKDTDDVINWATDKYKDFVIVSEARDQGEDATCQFFGAVAEADMGYKRSRANHGKSSDIHFEAKDLIAGARKEFKIVGEFTLENTCTSSDVMDVFEDIGVNATCSEWTRRQKKKLDGSSYGKPKGTQVIELIEQAVPLAANFQCCRYLGKLKPDEVYKTPDQATIRKKRRWMNLSRHMVLICGYGFIDLKLLYLIFMNSWTKEFCKDGTGRILFSCIDSFHTVEIHCHPQAPIKAKAEKTITLYCWSFARKVEENVASACPFMSSRMVTPVKGGRFVHLPSDVTPLALCLIIKFLRFPKEEQEKVAFIENFLKVIDSQTLYDVFRAADSLQMQDLARCSASLLLKATMGWSVEQFRTGLRHEKDEREWELMKNKIIRLAEGF